MFVSPAKLLENITHDSSKYDLLFLDILFDKTNGIKLAQSIREAGSKAALIYTTVSRDYAIDGYKVQASDYLVKPIDKDTLADSIGRVLKKNDSLLVEADGKFKSIQLSDIGYVESCANYVILRLPDGKENARLRATLTEVQNRLGKDRFARCHKGYLVNLAQVREVLTAYDTGEFYRIYKASGTDVSAVEYTSDDKYLYFTDYSSGDYTVMLANALYVKNSYKGRYDSTSGKYILDLYFYGADACYGSFGLKYGTTLLTLDGFVFADGLFDYGSISIADGGFGTYYNADGIYQNTWSTQAGIFASGEASPVKIGTFTFSLSENADSITETAFTEASLADTDITLDAYTSATVYSGENYMYAPMTASTKVYPQPINTTFELSAEDEKYTVTLLYSLQRDYENEYFHDESIYDGRAKITVKDENGNTVCEVSESDCIFIENEKGKTDMSVNFELANGEYVITFVKNGYIATTCRITVSGSAVNSSATPVAGDIKNEYKAVSGDGIVDIDDFIRVLRGLSSGADEKLCRSVDINEDGVVNITDIAFVKMNFGKK